MKPFIPLAAALALLVVSGCLLPEKIETRIRFNEENAPAEVTIIYHNMSSEAKDDEALQSDFRELIDSWKGDKYLVQQAKQGLILKDRQVYLENGKLQAKELSVPTEENFLEEGDMVISRGERIVIVDADDAEIIETNGKILRTEQNYVIVWPEELREIYWIQRLLYDDEDKTRLERNRPKLIKMFEAYQQKGN
jgi:hypothetical protein